MRFPRATRQVFVKVNGKLCYLWRAVDHEGGRHAPYTPRAASTGELPLAIVEPYVEDRRAVREPADRNEIDPGFRDRRRGFEIHAARGFADNATADHRDALSQLVERHVVEQDGIDANAERLFKLRERALLQTSLLGGLPV